MGPQNRNSSPLGERKGEGELQPPRFSPAKVQKLRVPLTLPMLRMGPLPLPVGARGCRSAFRGDDENSDSM